MKDEASGTPITEFVGLRSKMYSYTVGHKKEIKKCKRITKGVVKKKMFFEDYRDALFNTLRKEHSMKTIRSMKHDLKSYNITKYSLSCYDNKIYILDNGIQTLPYGHYKALNTKNC